MVRKAQQQDFEQQQPKMIMARDGKRRPDRRCDTSTRGARIIGLRHASDACNDGLSLYLTRSGPNDLVRLQTISCDD
jgi:hypothetical protein